MGRASFIDCQIAITPFGERAKFKRAKVGLFRKGSSIYIATFAAPFSSSCKFKLEQQNIQLLPASIRLKDLKSDLFIKNPKDKKHYDIMMREIKVILKGKKLLTGDKHNVFDNFIAKIPTFDSLDALKAKDLVPGPLSVRLVGNTNDGGRDRCYSCSEIHSCGQFFGCGRCQETSGDGTHGNHHGTVNNKVNCDSYGPKRSNTGQHKKVDSKRLNNKFIERIKIQDVDHLPKELWLRTSLYELTLTNCNLTKVPKQLVTLSSTLTFLDLSDNKIAKLPRVFCCKMNNLRQLHLNHNQIETLPIEIKFFSSVVDLDISDNRLRMLPTTFSDLRSLRHLNVANNNLSQLPAFRKDEIRLESLDVSNNPLDGALSEFNTFEVHPSYDGPLSYEENLFCPLTSPIAKKKHFPTLFEISMLNIVRCDRLLKLASEESLPKSIVLTMQRDIFKCYKCSKMNILPAYNSTDILDYVDHVEKWTCTHSRHRMAFMKLLCRKCFDNMSS